MTRTLVFSDVHGNLAGLRAVLNDAFSGNDAPDEYWFLGDLLGYGPWPIEVWDTLKKLPIPAKAWLAGNHDWGVLGKLTNSVFRQSSSQPEFSVDYFREKAWEIIQEHQSTLKPRPDINTFLDALPVSSSPQPGVYLVHGEFNENVETSLSRYTYMPTLSPASIQRETKKMSRSTPDSFTISHPKRASKRNQGRRPASKKAKSSNSPRIICYGHTHQPGAWRWQPATEKWVSEPIGSPISFGNLTKSPLALNPGSTGFPRGAHRCPSYVLIDWEKKEIQFRFISYNAEQLKQKMEQPPFLNLLTESGFWRDPADPCSDVVLAG